MALLASAAAFAHIIGGLTNKGLWACMAALFQPGYRPAQATYDLRRLRLKGFICRPPGTNTYGVTPEGLRIATFFTHLGTRVVVPTLTDLAQLARPRPPRLAAAWRDYERELISFVKCGQLAARPKICLKHAKEASQARLENGAFVREAQCSQGQERTVM